jgi:hypothetical protein
VPFSSSPIPATAEKMRAAMQGRAPYIPIEMDQKKIDETVMKYAMACKRMQQAGMDIALLHGGHGNLIPSLPLRTTTSAPTSTAAPLRTARALPSRSLRRPASCAAKTLSSTTASRRRDH